MAANAPFRGMPFGKLLEQVCKIEEFLPKIDAGYSFDEISRTYSINIYELRTTVKAYRVHSIKVDKLKTAGFPENHLNHLKYFSTEKSAMIKQEATAKAMTGMEMEKALRTTEMEMEDRLCAALDHENLTYGTIPLDMHYQQIV